MSGRQLDVQYAPIVTFTPAGTTGFPPVVTPVSLGDVYLVAVQVRIPPGHSGLTGVAVKLGDTVIVPWGRQYIIGDDDYFEFAVGMEIDTGLVVETFNDGAYDHRHYLRFVWRAITDPTATQTVPTLTLLPNSLLSSQ